MTSPTLAPPQYTVALPAGMTLMNANDRISRYVRDARVKAIREAAYLIARSLKIRDLECAHVYYVLHPVKLDRRRDPGNWAPSAKAAVDGIVKAGVMRDDNSRLLVGPDPRLGTPQAREQLVLVITDLTNIDPALLALLDPTSQLDASTAQ